MEENTQKIDLENADLAKFDFRIPFVLGKNLMEEWGEIKNSLYRMLWFHKNFSDNKLQVEAHPVALAVYTELYKGNGGQSLYKIVNGKLQLSNSNVSVSADVMNGWRGPLNKFCGLSARTQSEWMKEEYKKYDDAEMSQELAQSYKKDECTCCQLLQFLDVVYTIGNFTPVPTGCCLVNSHLDNWAIKLYNNMIWGWVGLLESLSCLEVRRVQYYTSHKFEGYINNGKPTAYWKNDKHIEADFSKPDNDDEWTAYFKKTKELITNRAKDLLLGHLWPRIFAKWQKVPSASK